MILSNVQLHTCAHAHHTQLHHSDFQDVCFLGLGQVWVRRSRNFTGRSLDVGFLPAPSVSRVWAKNDTCLAVMFIPMPMPKTQYHIDV